MSELIEMLERLCEASDDVVYAELRGTSEEIKTSRSEFDKVWNEAIERLEVKK